MTGHIWWLNHIALSRVLRTAALGIFFCCLCGCAAQIAYKDGIDLISRGETREGLRRLEDATRIEPSSPVYRAAWIRNRDAYSQSLLDDAEASRKAKRFGDAEATLSKAISLGGLDDRALSALRNLEWHKRIEVLLEGARRDISSEDWQSAKEKTATVLRENPRHTAALQLISAIDQHSPTARIEPSLSDAFRLPITIEFRDVPLRNVFEIISRTSRLNFVFDKDVKVDQRTSIYLRDSTVGAAVSWVLMTNQLERRVLDDRTILVYPSTPAKLSEYQPVSVKSFFLANAEAKSVAATLKALLKSKDVVVDEKLNLVILRDRPEAIKLAEKLVSVHEVPEPEVMLEVEILEVKRDSLLDLGLRWPERASLSLLPLGTGNALTLEDLRNPTRRSVGVSAGSAVVTAQSRNSDTNILANPRIRTRNREKAKIMIGERLPNITTTSTATGFVAESITYVDVGLKLEVEPTIYLDGEVAIKVALEVSSITSQQTTKTGAVAYQLGTRNAQTVLRLKDGENQVLAGLINSEERKTSNKVPGLGSVPLIGRLFGGQADDLTKSEIILSITPRILRNVDIPPLGVIEFTSGTESNLKDWPDVSAKVLTDRKSSVTPSPSRVSFPASVTEATAKEGSTQSINGQAGETEQRGAGRGSPSQEPISGNSSPPTAPFSVATMKSANLQGVSRLTWEGPTQLRRGEEFAIQLLMQSEQPVVSVMLLLAFDPKTVELISATEGDFLKENSAHTQFVNTLVGSGQLSIFNTRTEKRTGARAPAALSTFRMRIKKTAPSGSTKLRLSNLSSVSASGDEIIFPSPSDMILNLVE